MHYFHTHFNVYPNPQGKVYASHNKATPDVACGEFGVIEHTDKEFSCRKDVEQQVRTDKSGAGSDVGQTEQHAQGNHKVQAVLKVGPLIAPIQGLAVGHPKHAVVCEVSNVPEQQQGSVVVVDQDVSVCLEESSH